MLLLRKGEHFYDGFVKNVTQVLHSRSEEKLYSSALSCKLFCCDNYYIGVCKYETNSKNKKYFDKTNEAYFQYMTMIDFKTKKMSKEQCFFRLVYNKKNHSKDNFCYGYVHFWNYDTEQGDLLYRDKKAEDYHIYINYIGKESGFATEKDIIDDFVKHVEILKLKISISSIDDKVSFCFDRMNNFILAKQFIPRENKIDEKRSFGIDTTKAYLAVDDIKSFLPPMRILKIKEKKATKNSKK